MVTSIALNMFGHVGAHARMGIIAEMRESIKELRDSPGREDSSHQNHNLYLSAADFIWLLRNWHWLKEERGVHAADEPTSYANEAQERQEMVVDNGKRGWTV